MNTKIARRLNEALRNANPSERLVCVADEITLAHNIAVTNGFLELPVLDYKGATSDAEGEVTVAVTPRCGMMSISDLWMLRGEWGADDLQVCDEKGLVVLMVFKMK